MLIISFCLDERKNRQGLAPFIDRRKRHFAFIIFLKQSAFFQVDRTLINTINISIMNSLLYIIAVILIIGWALGAFVYSAGSLIHVLLVIAIIAIILGVIRGRSVI
jgi:hypothetical protein